MSMKGSQLKKAPKTIKRLLELRKEVIVTMEKRILQVTRSCKPTGAETQPSLSIIETLQSDNSDPFKAAAHHLFCAIWSNMAWIL